MPDDLATRYRLTNGTGHRGCGAAARILLSLFCLVVFAARHVSADNSSCLECHSVQDMFEDYGTRAESLVVTEKTLSQSTHRGFDCVSCHSDLEGVDDFPHADQLKPVDCGQCHSTESELYKWHGRLAVGIGEDIPMCADCHGTHDIRHSSERESGVNPLNLPATCGRCHEDIDLVRKHEILLAHPVELFENSVHGRASLGGVHLAATCNDCHSTNGTAHIILSPGNPQSSVNHFNIPGTCGRCHSNIAQDYLEGIHGQLAMRGQTASPVCTNCHGEHGILRATDPRSPVSPTRVAEATCSPCHESARLNEKYGIPTGRLKTWVDSYHGLKSRAGDLTVANCASCHGAHRILPSSDSTSSVHAANLQHTCGTCHPGITTAVAQRPIHGPPGVSGTPAALIVRQIYIYAIVIIIGAMVTHWLIDLRKQIVLTMRRRPRVRRMTLGEVWQHTFLMVTFIVLVISGFALRFSESWWVKFLFGWEGGFPLRGIIHRVSAVLFIISAIWHIFYLGTHRGRRFLADIFPRRHDLNQFGGMIAYNLDLRPERPRFGRFSYVEKAEYWALVWGTVVMIISGFFMWAENLAVRWFPKGFLDVMLVVHYYEAWLATLAVFIWHLYSTVFSPGVYPMNPSWLTGHIPLEMYRHEHPDDPALHTVTGTPITDSDSGDPAHPDQPKEGGPPGTA